jgi:GT2 family glycosyltransferase
VRSIADQDPERFYLVSNGSTDGTERYVASVGGTVVNDPVTSCGHGMNVTLGILAKSGCDVAVFSNDDIEWKPGSFKALEAFLRHAPENIIIASGLLEDDYPWNTVYETVFYGGQTALVRRTAPGGTWAIRPRDWETIRPIPESPGYDDVPTCERLATHGYRFAQLDLATHIGQDVSTWGNGSRRFGKPLDRERWGI